jgi:hypothetical protein
MPTAIVMTNCHHEPDSHQSPANVFMAGSYMTAVASPQPQSNPNLAGACEHAGQSESYSAVNDSGS